MSKAPKPEYSKYDDPKQIASDTALPQAEKIKRLEIWYKDEDALLRASGEGLTGGPKNRLGAVLRALESVDPDYKLPTEA